MTPVSLQEARVAIVLAGLSAGGAERVVAQLAEHWNGLGARVTVLAFDSPGDPIYHPLPDGVEVRRLDVPGGGALAVPRRILALRRALRANPPDVLLSLLTKINAVALAASLGTDIPVIVAERNNPERQQASRAWNPLLRMLYPGAAAIVCQTWASMRCIPARQRHRGVVIPNPVRRYPIEPDPAASNVLSAVGRLTGQKGFDRLLQAFAAIADRHPAWTLQIWGEGPDQQRLEAQASQLGLARRVQFRGLSAEPGGWIAESGAFVLSSRYEGFPNVLGEAMAAGLPVLATRCDFGPAEMIEPNENGLLVEQDVSSIAQGLDRLMSDAPLRARIGRQAQAIQERFSPERVLAEWDQLLLDVVGEHSVRADARPKLSLAGGL